MLRKFGDDVVRAVVVLVLWDVVARAVMFWVDVVSPRSKAFSSRTAASAIPMHDAKIKTKCKIFFIV